MCIRAGFGIATIVLSVAVCAYWMGEPVIAIKALMEQRIIKRRRTCVYEIMEAAL